MSMPVLFFYLYAGVAIAAAVMVGSFLFAAFLVGAERHVHDDEGVPDAAHDGGRVAEHVEEGDREGVVVAEQGGADGIADENQRDAGLVEEAGGLEIVGGEGGDFFDAFHGHDGAGGQSFRSIVHGGPVTIRP